MLVDMVSSLPVGKRRNKDNAQARDNHGVQESLEEPYSDGPESRWDLMTLH